MNIVVGSNQWSKKSIKRRKKSHDK